MLSLKVTPKPGPGKQYPSNNVSLNNNGQFSLSVTKPTSLPLNKPISFSANPNLTAPNLTNPNLTAHDVTRYTELDHRSHVYQIPDTYIGCVRKVPRDVVLLDMSDSQQPRMVRTQITLPVGLERTFIEIISNAGDNVTESRDKGVDPGDIRVTMDSKRIVVRNSGLVIPIEINPQTGVYAAEMIFGRLLTSSNYGNNKQRLGAGRNGYGAKITNIFSTYFQVDIGDPGKKKTYRQIWQDNMQFCSQPVIEDNYEGPPYVQITYDLEHKYFGYDEYPAETFSLFARHCVDLSFNHKIKVMFNERVFETYDIKNFSEYYFGSGHEMLIHYEWLNDMKLVSKVYQDLNLPLNTDPAQYFSLYWAPELVKKKNGVLLAKNNVLPLMEIGIVDTPGIGEDDEGCVIAFVNGIVNSQGGIHANKVFDAIKGPILSKINSTLTKMTKGQTDKKPPSLTVADLKRNVSIIVSLRTFDTEFNSQSKDVLTACKLLPDINIAEERFKCVDNWNLKRRLVIALEAKLDRLFAKTDGKRKGRSFVYNSQPANNAGKGVEKSKQCVLVLTEGNSARNYAIKMYEYLMGKTFRDWCGFFPLRGKLLNVREANPFKVLDNKEIAGIKQMMGLKEKTDYTKEENMRQLRYWHLVIIADPDVDGKHIAGLVVNWLDARFDSLLRNGMVSYIKLPIIRAHFNRLNNKFYTLAEVKAWQSITPNNDRFKFKYFKGLGTSTDKDIKEDAGDLYQVRLFYDKNAKNYLEAAFNPKRSGSRKNMIERYKPDDTVERYQQQAISHFINYEVIEFSVADVNRSIPAFSDGLKKSQRQILYTVLTKWGKKIGKDKLESVKVSRLGPEVATLTNYHHGEDALSKAIINMAQDYVGSNNLNLLFPDGQFGERDENGKDASAPRYISTYPMWWLRLVFRFEDDDILTRVIEEGEPCEYERYYPIIPTSLINGVCGIATGFSSFIPPYNPIDLCIWLVQKLHNLPTIELKPWYRGFKGEVNVLPTSAKNKTSENKNDKPKSFILNIGPKTNTPVNSVSLGLNNLDPDDKPVLDDLGEAPDDMGEDHVDFDLGTKRCETGDQRYSVFTEGVYECHIDRVIITELPIGRSFQSYRNWLESLVKNNKITNFTDNCTAKEPYFTIMGMSSPDAKSLRLVRSFGLSNMVLLDEDNKPRYYKTIDDVMNSFYKKRLFQYQRRKDAIIAKILEDCRKLSQKQALILEIVEKRLEVRNRPREEIYAYMDAMKIEREVLKQINVLHLSYEDVLDLQQKIAAKQAELQTIQNTPLEVTWEKEIAEFVTAYLKHYPEERNRFNYPDLEQTMLAQYRPTVSTSSNFIFVKLKTT